MTDSEGKALNIVLLSKKVYTKATTLNTGSWRSLLHEARKPVPDSDPEWRDESWIEERKPPKHAAKTTPDDDDMFEAQE